MLGVFGQRVGGGACNLVEPLLPSRTVFSQSNGSLLFGQPFMYQIMRKRLSARQTGAVPLNGG